MSNFKNPIGFRRCYLCDQTFAATIEFFPKDKNRPLGIGYQCRSCARIQVRNRDKTRPTRELTQEQKARRKIWQKEYAPKNRDSYLLGAYKSVDKKKGFEFNLTKDWFVENIRNKPCFYCEELIESRGCDRINNTKGHTKSNVVPCCYLCNTTRMDNYTHEEMILIGKTIRQIKNNRLTN